VRAWNLYRDHLNTPPKPDDKAEEWAKEGNRLFLALLDKMAKALDYDFEELLIRKGSYIPQAHGELESDQLLLRKGLLGLLEGSLHLKMDVVSLPQQDDEELKAQQKLRDLSIEYFEGKKPVPVTIVEKEPNTRR